MGNFAGSLGGHFTLHTDVFEVATNIGANTSTVRCHTYITCDSSGTGVFNLSGSASWNANVNGNTNGGHYTYDFRGNANGLDLNTYDTVVGHDGNGNATISWSGAADMQASTYATTSNTSGILGLSRLPLGPGIAGITADSITPTSARLGGEITSYGHGTSVNMNMYYRLQGAGAWIDLGNQADAAGYNYWTVTGLQPGKTYEYTMNVWNNNGDLSQSATQTFKTIPVSGMITVIKGIF